MRVCLAVVYSLLELRYSLLKPADKAQGAQCLLQELLCGDNVCEQADPSVVHALQVGGYLCSDLPLVETHLSNLWVRTGGIDLVSFVSNLKGLRINQSTRQQVNEKDITNKVALESFCPIQKKNWRCATDFSRTFKRSQTDCYVFWLFHSTSRIETNCTDPYTCCATNLDCLDSAPAATCIHIYIIHTSDKHSNTTEVWTEKIILVAQGHRCNNKHGMPTTHVKLPLLLVSQP